MNDLSEKIIDSIKRQGIVPRARFQFLLKTWVLWSIVFLSMVLGGVAIALIIFVFVDYDASTRVLLNKTIFEDLLETIPYFWILTLVLLIAISRYTVRLTTFGYRYTTLRIVAASLLGSVLLGMTLQATEVAERIQDFLVEQVPYYREITPSTKSTFSKPAAGLLGGTITTIFNANEIEIIDQSGKRWHIDLARLKSEDDVLIRVGAHLRFVGTQEDEVTFRALRAVPWKL